MPTYIPMLVGRWVVMLCFLSSWEGFGNNIIIAMCVGVDRTIVGSSLSS